MALQQTRSTKQKRKPKGASQPARRVLDVQKINAKNRIRATSTGTRLFDRSLHKTNIWLKEVMELMNWQNRERALSVLRCTLHSLRDILPTQEIPHLGAQLPVLVRGLYYENWHIHPEPLRLNSVNEFYELVREKLGRGSVRFRNDELRKAIRACLFVVTEHVSAGEIYDIKSLLRRNLRDLIEFSFDELRQSSRAEMPAQQKRSSTRQARKKLSQAEGSRQRRSIMREVHRQHSELH